MNKGKQTKLKEKLMDQRAELLGDLEKTIKSSNNNFTCSC